MTHPTIPEINPSTSIYVKDAEASRGSPDLDPFIAWQYDLGVEVYFGETQEGIFAVAGFIKDVESFIVPINSTETFGFPQFGIPAQAYSVSSYKNGGEASISGLEFNLQTPFIFLPDALANFGGAFNYPYTDSEFTDVNGNSFTFPGASKDTYNLIVYYEQGGFSGRIAYSYRGDYLDEVSDEVDGSNTLYGEGTGRLDLSLRYRWQNGLRLSVDATNLTEESSYRYYDIAQCYQNYEFEGTIYSISMGYSY